MLQETTLFDIQTDFFILVCSEQGNYDQVRDRKRVRTRASAQGTYFIPELIVVVKKPL